MNSGTAVRAGRTLSATLAERHPRGAPPSPSAALAERDLPHQESVHTLNAASQVLRIARDTHWALTRFRCFNEFLFCNDRLYINSLNFIINLCSRLKSYR